MCAAISGFKPGLRLRSIGEVYAKYLPGRAISREPVSECRLLRLALPPAGSTLALTPGASRGRRAGVFVWIPDQMLDRNNRCGK